MLALALLVVVAAPLGGEPGTTQAAWQVAAVVLQFIMQLVVVEVCAKRSQRPLPAAADPALAAAIDPAIGSTMQTTSEARTPTSPCKFRATTIAPPRPRREALSRRLPL